jgi:hypothetical protein
MIRVEIPYSKFWDMAKHQPVHMNISVFKALRNAGIPVDGGIDMRGVTHGRLTCFNEMHPEKGRVCVYEWDKGTDTPDHKPAPYVDDEDEL